MLAANLHNLESGDASLMMRNRISDLFWAPKVLPTRISHSHKRANLLISLGAVCAIRNSQHAAKIATPDCQCATHPEFASGARVKHLRGAEAEFE